MAIFSNELNSSQKKLEISPAFFQNKYLSNNRLWSYAFRFICQTLVFVEQGYFANSPKLGLFEMNKYKDCAFAAFNSNIMFISHQDK